MGLGVPPLCVHAEWGDVVKLNDALNDMDDEQLWTIRDENGDTPLIWAARKNSAGALDCLKKLLGKTKSGGCYSDIDAIGTLAKRGWTNPNEDGIVGTALHAAAYHANTEAVKVLIENGADQRILTIKGRRTALDLAEMRHQGNAELLDLFDPSCRKIETVTSLDKSMELCRAAKDGDVTRLNKLIKNGARAARMCEDEHGDTPLIWAARHNKQKAVKCLLRGLATGESALAVIDRMGTLNDEKWLWNGENGEGIVGTALHAAIVKGHTDVARLLLQAGASTTLRTVKPGAKDGKVVDAGGLDAIGLATAFGQDGLVKELKRAALMGTASTRALAARPLWRFLPKGSTKQFVEQHLGWSWKHLGSMKISDITVESDELEKQLEQQNDIFHENIERAQQSWEEGNQAQTPGMWGPDYSKALGKFKEAIELHPDKLKYRVSAASAAMEVADAKAEHGKPHYTAGEDYRFVAEQCAFLLGPERQANLSAANLAECKKLDARAKEKYVEWALALDKEELAGDPATLVKTGAKMLQSLLTLCKDAGATKVLGFIEFSDS